MTGNKWEGIDIKKSLKTFLKSPSHSKTFIHYFWLKKWIYQYYVGNKYQELICLDKKLDGMCNKSGILLWWK